MVEDYIQPNQTIEETMPNRPQINSDLMRWMIDGVDIVSKIEVDLTGKTWYNGKNTIVRPNARQLINQEGLNSIIIIVSSNIGKAPVNSNLTVDEIREVMSDLRRDLDDKIYMHWKEWDIKESDVSTVRAVVENNCLYALKRGEEGQESKRIFGSVKRTDVNNLSPKKSGGFMGFLGLK